MHYCRLSLRAEHKTLKKGRGQPWFRMFSWSLWWDSLLTNGCSVGLHDKPIPPVSQVEAFNPWSLGSEKSFPLDLQKAWVHRPSPGPGGEKRGRDRAGEPPKNHSKSCNDRRKIEVISWRKLSRSRCQLRCPRRSMHHNTTCWKIIRGYESSMAGLII